MSANKNFALVTGEEREKVRSLVREHAGALAHLSDSCHTILFRVEDKVYFVIQIMGNELGVLKVENPIYDAESDWGRNVACGLIAIYDILDFFEALIDEIEHEDEDEKKHLARFMKSLMILQQSVEDQVFDILMQEIERANQLINQLPKKKNPTRKTRWDLLN